jgi:hypothetical protein
MSFSFKKEIAVQNEYAPIAPGVYTVQFESLEEKVPPYGGIQWSAKMKILGTGRIFFLSWNVEHANEIVQRIARNQISQIAELLGTAEDISINTIKTNKHFIITLEQRSHNDKIYYQTKGDWKLAESTSTPLADAVKKVQESLAVKKTAPWK